VGFETLLDAEPRNPRLHEAAAAIFLTLGQVTRGVEHLETALRIDPRSTEAHYNLATALAWQGRPVEAESHLTQALTIAPDHVGAHVNLGALLRARGERIEATRHFERAVQLSPSSAAAHANLGAMLMQDRQVLRAVGEYRKALDANPQLLEPLTELAWTLSTSPSPAVRNGQEAVTMAERARALTEGRDVRALDALAAAYASIGRFDEAVRTVDAALALVPSTANGSEETRRLLRSRRAVYAGRRPFIDPARGER
jgi:tetratricopeptide (TPR) repeat protein